MSSELVPFGKYKGRPVEMLLADEEYRDWLLGQPWFRSRFATIYQTIINYGGEPQETPEHNELQASFLVDDRCFRLARLLYPRHHFDRDAAERVWGRSPESVAFYREFKEHLQPVFGSPKIADRQFEVDGWDVVYRVAPADLTLVVKSLPGCACGPCDHGDCPELAPCRGARTLSYGCRHDRCTNRFTPTIEWLSAASSIERSRKLSYGFFGPSGGHCTPACPWADEAKADWLLGDPDDYRWFQPSMPGRVLVECKPDVGDDFPAVLRQVTSYRSGPGDQRCVVIRRAEFEKVSWEQVEAIFAASQIVLLREAQLDEAQG